jgi:hypothetical protein
MSDAKYIARNNPVTICVIKHSPASDPNLHKAEMFLGHTSSKNESPY